MKYDCQYTIIYKTKKNVIIEAFNRFEAERKFNNTVFDCFEKDYMHELEPIIRHIDTLEGIDIYVNNEKGQPVNARQMETFCGLYAGIGKAWNNPNGEAGELFCVMCGPQLWPAYDQNGHRLNVGADRAGMSYDEKTNTWYNE